MRIIILFTFLLYSIKAHTQVSQHININFIETVKSSDIGEVDRALTAGAVVNEIDSNKATALMWAVYKGNLQMVKYLVKHNADPSIKGVIYLNTDKTSYFGNLTGIAGGLGHIDILEYLIGTLKINVDDKEFDPETKTETGWTALQWASSAGHIEAVKYLLKKGANIEASFTADKGTALIYALQNKQDEVARLLIMKGANVNAATYNGETPIMISASNINLEMCIFLWQNNAILSTSRADGKTLYDIAIEKKLYRIRDFSKNPSGYAQIQTKIYWEELNDSLNYYRDKEMYSEAIRIGIYTLPEAKQQYGDSSEQYATSLVALADLYNKTNQVKELQPLLIMLINRYRNAAKGASVEFASMLNQLGMYQENLKNFNGAVQSYEEAYTILKSLKQETNLLTSVMFNLADLYDNIDSFYKAEPLYLERLELRKKFFGREHEEYINSLQHLKKVYTKRHLLSNAITTTEELLSILRKTQGTDSSTFNNNLIDLAELYEANKQDTLAAQAYEKAIIYLDKTYGESSAQHASRAGNLATVYLKLKQYGAAEGWYQNAVNIYRKIYGEEHEYFTTSSNNLANFYDKINKLDKADSLYNFILQVRKKSLSTNHPDYVESLLKLADFYYRNSRYGKAELLYKEYSSILSRYDSSEQAINTYANSLNKLALIYQQMGDYTNAEITFKSSIEIFRKLYGISHANPTQVIYNLADMHLTARKFSQAEQLYKQLLQTRILAPGVDGQKYLTTLEKLTELYTQSLQYDSADLYFNKILSANKQLTGIESKEYASALALRAAHYNNTQRKQLAAELYDQFLTIKKKLTGEMHLDYTNALYTVAFYYLDQVALDKTDSLLQRELSIIKKMFGDEDLEYASTLSKHALVYEQMGQFNKSIDFLKKSLSIRKNILGENHPHVALSLEELAGVYFSMDQYDKVEILLIEAVEKRKNELENHDAYAKSLDKLAAFYQRIGQNNKAEYYYKQVVELRLNILGEQHESYSLSLDNLAQLYTVSGKYSQGLPLSLGALEIAEKIYGKGHSVYADREISLARQYIGLGNFQKAEPILVDAVSIKQKGNARGFYAFALSILSDLYVKMGENEKAEMVLLKQIDAWVSVFGKNHLAYALGLNSLALFYQKIGNYEKAEKHFQQVISVHAKSAGTANPAYADYLKNLAFLYQDMGKNKEAESLFSDAKDIGIANMFSVFGNLSEKEKGNFLANKVTLNSTLNSFQFNNPTVSPKFTSENYDLQLLMKSLTLAATRNLLESVRNSKDTSVVSLYNKLQSNRAILSRQYSLISRDRRKDIQVLEEETENIEKQLARKSTEFRNQKQASQITVSDVRKNLEENEVAIEFVRFDVYNKQWTNNITYGAYLLNKSDSIPVFVPLCEEKRLQQIFDSAGLTATSMVSKFYRGIGKDKSISADLGKELYKLIWQPLEPYLISTKKVSYSPAGKLYSIAFHALPIDSNLLLMDRYELQQYTSTREVVLRNLERKSSSKKDIVLFGNPNFNLDIQAGNIAISNANSITSIYIPQNRGAVASSWSGLPGTADEVIKIKNLFAENKIPAVSYTLNAASEETLKALDGRSPKVLHIATHGFFLPEPPKNPNDASKEAANSYTLSADPLLRSGLLFAGANHAWSGKSRIEGKEDGIGTAYEISQLNLSNTELVVLSACETALGDIKGSEGVFGLQRAFKMAGVKKLIVSLWQVPDKETAELMTLFYSKWLKGNSIESAFAGAQSEMRKKYKPFYWAAFVLVQ